MGTLTVIVLVALALIGGFVAGALVMRRHYEKIRKVEDALKSVKVG